ncbi:MAG: hypothetical protein L6R41_001895 [Letrouitia leprolyta]|nr:MAG: hypothetical protein L6R41_001895 [Letrouitia leprolyta]
MLRRNLTTLRPHLGSWRGAAAQRFQWQESMGALGPSADMHHDGAYATPGTATPVAHLKDCLIVYNVPARQIYSKASASEVSKVVKLVQVRLLALLIVTIERERCDKKGV